MWPAGSGTVGCERASRRGCRRCAHRLRSPPRRRIWPRTMAADPGRVHRLLGRAELGWLVERLRRRMELGRPLTGTLTRPAATQAERAAVDALLGRARRPGSGTTVQL